MEKDMIKCPNCGADISPLVDKCPFCGFINPEGAEQKYMDSLEDVRKQLDVVDEEAAGEYKKGIGQSAKVVINTFIVVFILAAIVGAFFLIRNIYKNILYEKVYKINDIEDSPEELAWQQAFFSELDELYAAGDYEEMYKKYREGGMNHNVWTYRKASFLEYYSDYIALRDTYLPLLDECKLEKYSAEHMTAIVLRYYYEIYKVNDYYTRSLSDEDIAYLDSIRKDYVMDIAYTRMGYTKEELDAARKDVVEDTIFNWESAYKMSDKNYKRYN